MRNSELAEIVRKQLSSRTIMTDSMFARRCLFELLKRVEKIK